LIVAAARQDGIGLGDDAGTSPHRSDSGIDGTDPVHRVANVGHRQERQPFEEFINPKVASLIRSHQCLIALVAISCVLIV
jgi:hypothetical protein